MPGLHAHNTKTILEKGRVWILADSSKGIKTRGLDFDLEAVAPTIVVIMTEETPQTQHLSMLRGSWEGFSLFVCDR